MERRPLALLLLLFVSGLHRPSGLPVALGMETGEPLPPGKNEENATEVGGIPESHSQKVIPMTELQPSLPQGQQDTDEFENAVPVDEQLYESTFTTITVEDHPEVPDIDSNHPEAPDTVSNHPEASDNGSDHPEAPNIISEPPKALHPGPDTANLTSNTVTSPKEVIATNQEQGQTIPSSKEGLDGEGQIRSSEEEDEEEGCESKASPESMGRLAENMMAFSVDLFKQVDLESKQPNIVISPLSISLALSQLALGAGPKTEERLLQALHMESVRCLHKTLKSVRKNLAKRLLHLATRMYIRKGFKVKEEFLKRSEAFYGAKPVTLGPSAEENRSMMNSWAKEVTEGKISSFLSQIPQDLVLLLLNAMHFKGVWMNKFDSRQTSEERFYLSDQSMVPVKMMRAPKYPLSYFYLDHLDAQVARLPFKGNMSLIVILPSSFEFDTYTVLKNLNLTEMQRLFNREISTLLKVPKLLLDFKLELGQALTKLGLGELFFSPDLQRISEEALSVSSIQHQSTIELNEDGVEASAVTSVQLSRSIHSFSLNHPFIFLLQDDLTGMPLFLGCVRNPSPNTPIQTIDQSDSLDTKYFMKEYYPK